MKSTHHRANAEFLGRSSQPAQPKGRRSVVLADDRSAEFFPGRRSRAHQIRRHIGTTTRRRSWFDRAPANRRSPRVASTRAIAVVFQQVGGDGRQRNSGGRVPDPGRFIDSGSCLPARIPRSAFASPSRTSGRNRVAALRSRREWTDVPWGGDLTRHLGEERLR
jgi:hypothetical protein